MVVTLMTSQANISMSSKDVQWRLDHLSEQLTKMEEDKRKVTKERDELQKQVLQQKDRLLEAERESRYKLLRGKTNRSRLKSSLAGIEGEVGGQAKGETLQLQKSLRDLTTDSKLKDAEIQKMRDVCIDLARP